MTFPLSRFWPAWRLAPRTLRKLRWRHTSRQSPLSEPVICKGGRDHSRVTNKELSPGPQLNKFDVLECNCDPGRPSKTFRFYAVKGSQMSADLLKRTGSSGGRITYQVFNCSASVFSHIRNCAEQHLLVVFGLRIKWVWGKAIGEEWGVLY